MIGREGRLVLCCFLVADDFVVHALHLSVGDFMASSGKDVIFVTDDGVCA